MNSTTPEVIGQHTRDAVLAIMRALNAAGCSNMDKLEIRLEHYDFMQLEMQLSRDREANAGVLYTPHYLEPNPPRFKYMGVTFSNAGFRR